MTHICLHFPSARSVCSASVTQCAGVTKSIACLPGVLTSGNNENMGPGMQSDATVIDYSALYDDTLQVAVRDHDRSRPYWAASPSNGNVVDDFDKGLFIQRWGDENDARYGDAHIYPQFGRTMAGQPERAQIVDCEDLSRFGTARFLSEYPPLTIIPPLFCSACLPDKRH